jgi:predicted nuclease of predicted toxin-antitoxin system
VSLKLLSDENFHGHLVRGVLRIAPKADLIRVQDVGLRTVEDPEILAWAAQEGRILLTHDVKTMLIPVRKRLQLGLPMPGVIFVPQPFNTTEIIENLVLLAKYGEPGEYAGTWDYLPLR